MDSLLEQNKKFFDKISGFYDKFLFGNLPQKIIQEMEIKKNSKILDVGCGSGKLLFYLERQDKGLRLFGVDISEKMMYLAGKKLGKNARLKIQNAEDIKFRKNYFDYIFSVDAFHHYADEKRVMNNFYKILKANGKLIVVDIDFGRFFNRVFHYIEPGNREIHVANEFKKIFLMYGFKKIRQKKIGFFTVMTTGVKMKGGTF